MLEAVMTLLTNFDDYRKEDFLDLDKKDRDRVEIDRDDDIKQHTDTYTDKYNKYEENDDYDKYTKKVSSSSSTSSSSSSSSSEEDIETRLANILKDDNDSSLKENTHGGGHREIRKSDELRRERDRDRHQSREALKPPTLSELQRRGIYKSKDQTFNLEYTDDDRVVMQEKREILEKFKTIRKKYPNADQNFDFSTFTIHSDLEEMKREYSMAVKRLTIDSSVSSNKRLLIVFFMITEYVLGRFFKLEMAGFTQQQMLGMDTYSLLLEELGEKSYTPTGSNLPVEVRLLGTVIFQAAIFLVMRAASNSAGTNFLGMFNQMSNPEKPRERPPKMSGPVDIMDL